MAYRKSFSKRRFTDAQRAAYWKKKYFAERKAFMDFLKEVS